MGSPGCIRCSASAARAGSSASRNGLFGALLFAGFWDKRLGILGAAGSTVTFIMTVTIIPFMPNGWAASAGGFPAMTGNIPFLMKDVVLLAASIYLLKQDVLRVTQQVVR
jgi:uncharacterized membrane protein YkgB